jgi:hypothetical protein
MTQDTKKLTFIRSFLLLLLIPVSVISQELKSPLEQKNFTEPTNYTELSAFVKQLDEKSPLLQVETIGKTVEGRNIYALKFSKGKFGDDKTKTRVLIFAQQHGNEQSGKEGALLLASELIKPENSYLLDKLDFALIPQINADGAEQNKRRNGHDADLNRNHLILEEPEVIALHHFFDQYLFEVTMDVHEYAPYFSERWKKFGYRCNSDELIGVNTNCNISPQIRNFSNSTFVPFYSEYLTKNKFSNSIYAPGGPPEIDYIRHSTFDINDGRQSFGIQNTFSLIQEGLNGEDVFKDRIERRAKGQMTGMKAVLEFAYQQAKQLKEMVASQRKQLLEEKPGAAYAIQMDHFKTGKQHPLPVYSYSTGNDSVIMVKDYRPLVKSILDIKRPVGYLVPKNQTELIDWSKRHELTVDNVPSLKKFKIEQYQVNSIDSIDFETDIIINPVVSSSVVTTINPDNYVYIPVGQLKGNIVITALEPKSELGLVTYPSYRHLLKTGEKFPVLRVVKK